MKKYMYCKGRFRFVISVEKYLNDYGVSFEIGLRKELFSKNLKLHAQIWDRHLFIMLYRF